MSTGDIIFMVVVVGVAILVAILKDKVPAWLGFVAILVASAVAIVGGAVTGEYKVIPLAVAFFIAAAIAWYAGGSSEVKADDNTLGAAIGRLKAVPWLIIIVLVVGGAATAFAIPEASPGPAKTAIGSRR